jgi:hypothetical protein
MKTKETKKSEEAKEAKPKKITGKRIKGVNTFEAIDGILLNDPMLIPYWARDPNHRAYLMQLVRARVDFQRIRMAADARMKSPTPTNPAELMPDDLKVLLLMGDRARDFEEQLTRMVPWVLQQSEVGRWLLAQPGLASGWLAAYILAEFPDIYDVRRCNVCGVHGKRNEDMTFTHPKPPKRKAIEGSAPSPFEEDEEDDGDGKESKGKKRCPHDGELMDATNSWLHERKPSTFVQFAGLGTVEAWACPHCGYALHWNSKGDPGWQHANYVKKPAPHACPVNNKRFAGGFDDHPISPLGVEAVAVRRSPKRVAKQKTSFNSLLRTKLVGAWGVAEQLVNNNHPKYRPLFDGYTQRIRARDPWRADDTGWIRQMGLRAVAKQFVIDFFTFWRKSEGLPCRLPYAEEKLGIVHHS